MQAHEYANVIKPLTLSLRQLRIRIITSLTNAVLLPRARAPASSTAGNKKQRVESQDASDANLRRSSRRPKPTQLQQRQEEESGEASYEEEEDGVGAPRWAPVPLLADV